MGERSGKDGTTVRPGLLARLLRFIGWRGFLAIVVVLVAGSVAWPWVAAIRRASHSAFDWEHAERATLTLLRSDKLMFLVTDRLVTQVVVQKEDKSLLWGKREGVLVGTARMYYGVNLEELTAQSVRREGDRLVIVVPEPKKLDFSVDLDSLKFIPKKSGLLTLYDWAKDRDFEKELRAQFQASAEKFMADNQMLPTRESIVERLNKLSGLFSKQAGVAVEFR